MVLFLHSNSMVGAAKRLFSEPFQHRRLLILLLCILMGPLLLLSRVYSHDFPGIHDWSSIRITLERTPCLGMCPSYAIEVRGDGTVLYNGLSYVAVTGQHRALISKQDLEGILQSFRRADYFNLWNNYRARVTDLPAYTTSIEIDGHSKKVIDYGGSWIVGMPGTVRKLEEAIDQLTDSARWTKGDAATFRSLQDENWDFKSSEAANTLARIAYYGSAGSLHDLISAGVPLNGHGSGGTSALEASALLGDLEKLREITEAQPHPDPGSLSSALDYASYGRKLEAVGYLLQRGADPNIRPSLAEPPIVAAAQSGVPAILQQILKYHPDLSMRGKEGRTALIAGVDSFQKVEDKAVNRLEIARLLVAAGAEVDARDDNGETALFKNAWDPEIANLLIQHGANVNSSDNRGWTPLYSASSAALTRALLEHGADVSVRNKEGKTPLDEAINYGDRDRISVLRAAEAKTRKATEP